MVDKMRLHNFESASRANGPGLRAVVWFQGCAFHCPGCFNPETHARAGQEIDLSEVKRMIRNAYEQGVTGITFSGGEPLQQGAALYELVAFIWDNFPGFDMILFTGYSRAELGVILENNPRIGLALSMVDVIIAGRYEQAQRVANHLQGSANKEFIFNSAKFSRADFETVPQAEIIIEADGTITLTGIDPLTLQI